MKMLETKPYNFNKIIHDCDDKGTCSSCNQIFSNKLQDNDLNIIKVWWTCTEYHNRAY
jgi:hypothetical protein